MFKYATIFLVSLLSALLCTPVIRRAAVRFGVMDLPGERRIHTRPIPRLGGVAVFLSLLIAFCFGFIADHYFHNVLFGHGPRLTVLLTASSIVVLIGALDDTFSLSAAVKLAGQVLAASILMFVGTGFGIIGGVHLGILGLPLTLLWLLAVTNAFNLIDGLDGLAAGVGAIVSATLFACFVYSGDIANAMLLAGLCGALTGFLRYNFHPAGIFLGDSGSLLIGFVLAAVSTDTGNRPSAIVAILVPMLALGMPLAETALTVIRRLLRTIRLVRYNPQRDRYEFLFAGNAALFTADRQHIHHRLLEIGLSHRNAVLLLYGVSLALGVASFGIVIYRQVNVALLLAAFAVVSIAGVRRLNYGELQVLRKGVLLPLMDSALPSHKKLQMLADLGFIVISYLVAVLIETGGMIGPEARKAFLNTLPIVAVTQISSLALCGLYRPSYRNGGIGALLASLKCVLIAAGTSWLTAVVLDGWSHFSLPVAVLDTYMLVTTAIGGRLSFRVLQHIFNSQDTGHRRALIYGTGNAGLSALYEIRRNRELDLLVIGFVENDSGASPRILGGLPVFGPDSLDDFIRGRQLDEVIIASAGSDAGVEHLSERCATGGIILRRFSIRLQEVVPFAFGNSVQVMAD